MLSILPGVSKSLILPIRPCTCGNFSEQWLHCNLVSPKAKGGCSKETWSSERKVKYWKEKQFFLFLFYKKIKKYRPFLFQEERNIQYFTLQKKQRAAFDKLSSSQSIQVLQALNCILLQLNEVHQHTS